MALGILIGCQEHLWMMRSFVAQRTQLSCGAMASPHAAILTWRAFTCFSRTQKVPVQGCGWHLGAGDTSAHCGQGTPWKRKGWTRSTVLKMWFKLLKHIINYQPASGRHTRSRKPCAGIGTTVARSRFRRWVGGCRAMNESWLMPSYDDFRIYVCKHITPLATCWSILRHCETFQAILSNLEHIWQIWETLTILRNIYFNRQCSIAMYQITRGYIIFYSFIIHISYIIFLDGQ